MKTKPRFFITVILILFLFACSSNDEDTFDSYFGVDVSTEELDIYVQAKMSELNLSGAAIAIINNGKVVHHNTYGYSDKAKVSRVNNQTIFEAASLSKSVFACFVMTFVEEGVLDLDRPLYEYYPHPDMAHDDRYKLITARHVLSHRTGFPNWREMEDDGKIKLYFEPGTDYKYSGEGYQYLAEVLMAISGTDHVGLERLFQERIAQPIGLEHTAFIQTPYIRTNKAEPYDAEGNWIDWQKEFMYLKGDGKFYAPSSIHTEPLDFSMWMIAVMNKEILSDQSYQTLFELHSKVPFDGLGLSYGLGFMKPDIPLTDLYFHYGNNMGFSSWYAMDIKDDWGFVMFTNTLNEQFGQDLFLYLLTGPSLRPFYLVGGILGFLIIGMMVWGVKVLSAKL